MTNVSKIESKLAFDKIRGSIAARCSTAYGRDRAENEEVSIDPAEIERRLGLADEMRVILMFETSFPTSGYADCIPFLVPLRSPFSHIDLPSLVLLRGALDTLRRILSFFSGCREGQYPLLRNMASAVLSFPEVLRRIDEILDKFGEVRDNASPELYSIRRAIKDKESAVSRRIQAILRKAQEDGVSDPDASVSVREGKMLIPVSSGNKKKVPGIVFDESASGRTSFIEPMEVVELNNQLRELHFEEQREILRILTEFTDFLRPYIDDVIDSQKFMGELDFILAKAVVSSRYRGGKPVLSDRGEVLLRQGRHPLLEEALEKEGKKIVPLDVVLTPQKRILLISGPNAGGKSVCLKTVGLLQYMFQWGMPVPASESSEMTVFNDMFVDIGDDQSLENDLSTYSSHLLNMKEAVTLADDRSLVLIDEFGSGTEPAAGGAIAEEILSEFEKKGCYGVITTHYTNLKFYASNSSRIANGAMLFDVQKIQPLFRLEIGLPGNSFAFELARKIGLPESIVHGAEERAGKDYVAVERNLRKIARNRRELEERLVRVKAADRTLDSMTERYEKELSEIKALRKSVLEEAKAQAAEIVAQANRQIENTIREIRESQAEKQRTQELRSELRDFAASVADDSAARSEMEARIERKMAQIIERKKRQEERRARRGADASGDLGNRSVPGGGTGAAGAGAGASSDNTAPDRIAPGVYVRVEDSGMCGEVVQISGKKAVIAVGEILSRIDVSKLTPLSANQYRSSVKSPRAVASSVRLSSSISDRKLSFKPSIDIRGMHLDEAIPTITRYIDDALMVGMSEVSILHGKGAGVLKEEIRKLLRITPGVVSFADEHVERGGSGITVVKLE
ncbi:MAG TPA: Smr/MutS family protein [Candidatus Coprenecus merdigallinarum]|nr:Smr/MutS family protein [Candidatus Coprenecus merdigallinarum]